MIKNKEFKGKYFIKKISYSAAMAVVVNNHYLHRKCPCSFAFGLIEKNGDNSGLFVVDKIVGVVIYGTPSSAPLRGGICGISEKDNVIELVRLWLCDSVPKNGESFLVGNTLSLVDKEIVVSFADTKQKHLGIIYQATNFIYTGLSAKRTNMIIKGVNKHSQTLADKYSRKDLELLIGADNVSLEQRSRKHRYVFFNCGRLKKKRLLGLLKYPVLKYPKK